MAIQLDYKLTRPFPWPWFSPAVLGGASVIIIFLTVINVALTGYQTVTIFSPTPNITNPHWYDHFLPTPHNPQPLCDPNVVNIGDVYTTNYTMFIWTIDSVTQANAGGTGALYSGEVLDNCDLTRLYMDGSITDSSIDLIPVVTCFAGGDGGGFGVTMKSAFSITSLPGRDSRLPGSVVTGVYDGKENKRTVVVDALSQYAGNDMSYRIAEALIATNGSSLDALSLQVDFPPCPASSFNNLSASSPCAPEKPAYNITLSTAIYGNHTILQNDDSQPINPTTNPQTIDSQTFNALSNIIQIILAGIRIDLGNPGAPVTADNSTGGNKNFILHPEVTLDILYSTLPKAEHNDEVKASVVEYWLSPMAHAGLAGALPVQVSGPATLQVVYLCRVKKIKPAGELFISVLVATLSMFSGGWGVLLIVATYFAKRGGRNANSCEAHNIAERQPFSPGVEGAEDYALVEVPNHPTNSEYNGYDEFK